MSKQARKITGAALASAVATALATVALPALAAESGAEHLEKCWGVALKGQNDCANGNHSCGGSSTVDYAGNEYKLVPTGTCVTMKTPYGEGSLSVLTRPPQD